MVIKMLHINFSMKPRMEREHYYRGYDDLARFISYFHQADLVRRLGVRDVLEVGIGNKTLTNYLRQQGFMVTTCDFDRKLQPDRVGDIRKLPFRDGSFDAVLAYEVLEHLPFDDFEKAIGELHRVTGRYAIISVPYSSLYFEVILNSPLMNKLFGRLAVSLRPGLPYFFLKPQESPHHYWEMGRKGYSLGRIRGILRKRFRIIRELRPVLNASHYFFVLERR